MKSAEVPCPPRPSAHHPVPAAARRHREELAFLPAALEIVETPPSPIGRAIGATIIAAVLRGAGLGLRSARSTSSPSATGKIVPSGRTKVIQPFETGVVRAIHVQDGQSVKAGDVLIELDPTMNAAERNHLHSDLVAAQLDVARLRAALADDDDRDRRLSRRRRMRSGADRRPSGSSCSTKSSEHRAKLAALDRQQAQKEAEHATIAATIAQARGDDPGAPAAGRYPQDPGGQGAGLQAQLS